VLQIQDLKCEVTALPSARVAVLRSPWRVAALFIGVLGGFCCAVLLSALLSHPAGAAVVPGANGSLPGQPSESIAQSVLSSVTTIPSTPQSPGNDIAPAAPVVTAGSPIVETVNPGAGTVKSLVVEGLHQAHQTVSQVVGVTLPSVAPLLSPVLGPTASSRHVGDALGLTSALPTVSQSVFRPASAQASRYAATSFAFNSSPIVPTHQPAPNGPAPQDPATPGGPSPDSSLPSFGSGPLAGHPAVGPLMPAPMVTGLVFGRNQRPELLLDLRSSPPG
jgi:hypothetical protein